MAAEVYWGLEIKDWVTVGAVLIGPILAVQAQKWVESIREKRERRLKLFRSLMSTRAERVSREHVQSLNQIDIEFYGVIRMGNRYQTRHEKAVTNAWKNYNSHLNDRNFPTHEAWFKHGDDLFAKMLYEMSQALGYDFDEVQIKRDAYRPDAHVNLENMQIAVLDGLSKALNNQSLSVTIAGVAQQEPAAAALNKIDVEAAKNEIAV
jgi:hypothetical protein